MEIIAVGVLAWYALIGMGIMVADPAYRPLHK